MKLTARLRTASLTGGMLAVAGIAAAGCSTSSPAASSAAGHAAAPSSASGTGAGTHGTAAATGGSATAATPGAPGSAAATSADSAGAPACTTNDLKITIGNYGGGTAGAYYTVIDFTNASHADCTLYGYPGVSLRNAGSAQLGAAATRTASPAPGLVTLAPGGTANATMRLTDSAVYPNSECGPVTTAYLRIYPPNQERYVQLSFPGGTTCSNSSIKMLGISAVASGAK
jgi:hypothetical protein